MAITISMVHKESGQVRQIEWGLRLFLLLNFLKFGWIWPLAMFARGRPRWGTVGLFLLITFVPRLFSIDGGSTPDWLVAGGALLYFGISVPIVLNLDWLDTVFLVRKGYIFKEPLTTVGRRVADLVSPEPTLAAKSVKLAILLFYIGIVLALVMVFVKPMDNFMGLIDNNLSYLQENPDQISAMSTAAALDGIAVGLILILFPLLIAFFITFIRSGKNWARITLLVITGLYLIVSLIDQWKEIPEAEGLAIYAVVFSAPVYALYLVFFGPAKTWFARDQG